MEIELKAKTANQARKEISQRFPQGANYTGYDEDGVAVIMSLVRPRGVKANVATVHRNRSKKAVRFICVPLEGGKTTQPAPGFNHIDKRGCFDDLETALEAGGHGTIADNFNDNPAELSELLDTGSVTIKTVVGTFVFTLGTWEVK